MTGAAGQIAYSLLYSIANGDVFGKDQVKQLLQLLNALCSLHTSDAMVLVHGPGNETRN